MKTRLMLVSACFILAALFQISCKSNEIRQVEDTNYVTRFKKDTTVLIFLSPECPICQKYIYRINEIKDDFGGKGLNVVGVVPTDAFSLSEIKIFEGKYGVDFQLVGDANNILMKGFGATVTPECIFMANGKIHYRGAIDNWFYAPGKSSNKTTKKYLETALIQFYENESITVQETKPIGCFIEY